jgi:hypothetical protein
MFARWIATQYEGILNSQEGPWWVEQLNHFEAIVYPEYIRNGNVEETRLYLTNLNKHHFLN